jgi:hypothetical protein
MQLSAAVAPAGGGRLLRRNWGRPKSVGIGSGEAGRLGTGEGKARDQERAWAWVRVRIGEAAGYSADGNTAK